MGVRVRVCACCHAFTNLHITNIQDAPGGEVKTPHRNQISLYRVTNQRLIVTNLRPLHNYSVTVTASTTSLTGHPTSTFVTPDEGGKHI